jgi:4-aminobutyrate aminotransferase-like enzyme
MAPPLSITESEIDTAIAIIDEAITAVLASSSQANTTS